MLVRTGRARLNLEGGIKPISFEVVQNDSKSNKLTIYLTANDVPYPLTDITDVFILFKKQDETVVQGRCTIIDITNSIVEYVLGTNEISVVGQVVGTIFITDAEGSRLTFSEFTFNVREDLTGNGTVESTTEFHVLTELIARVEAMDTQANHYHLNMTVLNALSDDNGVLEYNGQSIQGSGGTADSIAWSNVTGKPTFSSVATSGSYNDLTNRPTIPTQPTLLSQLTDDTTHRLTTDTEKTTWNGKQNALSGDVLGHYHSADRNWNNVTNKPTIPTDTNQLTKTDVYTKTEVDNRINEVTGGAGGDMYRSTYDTDLDGIVDRAEVADSVQWTNVQDRPIIPTTTSQLTNDSDFVTSVPTQLSQLSEDTTHRLVTDAEKVTWNGKPNSSDVYTKSEVDNIVTAIPTGGILTYQTLADAQTALPNGNNQPIWIVLENSWYCWDSGVTPPVDTTAPIVTISPTAGTYTSAQSVTLSADETSTIYYTLDGSVPTTSSTVYTIPISISATKTIKFFGRDSSGNSSDIQTQTYTINIPTPTVLDYDSFNRADSATTLGTTETGARTWQYSPDAVWGISAEAAYLVSPASGNNKAFIDMGVNNGVIESVYVPTTSNTGRILFRYVDESNFWNVTAISGKYVLYSVVGGSWTEVANSGTLVTPVDGDIIKVILNNLSIKIAINGTDVITVTNSALSSATKHGILASDSTIKFDYWKMTTL